ncbi:serine hydrolase domain-containing protein [Limnoglobus roseus]|uniref:D-aminoacylase n=1 Tax=Limnoglobus roseus TaxID=2598579 RepID=A0A5C1AGK2_9BACT|nr:serine hydrolase domain-containing protein [Limnoglobus roseus]QEL16872.1 D-aminoacylase [Limnoglobus roseus]
MPGFLCGRRAFLQITAGATLGLHARLSAADADLAPFDQLMTTFIAENKVPGAALAVMRHGELVYTRGFGYADVETKELVQPASLFRIASVSKPLTAVAILQLVERDKLKLDDKVLDRMPPFPEKVADPRWKQITVRQCLQHTGGWDRDKSFDPIDRPREIAKALGTPLPVKPEHVVRYMLGQKLDFDPGERYAYSNLGYLVLGRIIEAVSGRPYEEYVRKEVFAPLGVTAPRLGRALLENRAKNEVRYYDAKRATGRSVYPPREGERVPLVYGVMNLEGFEAHGGWIASAVDLVKFATAFDDPAKCPLLSAKSIAEMFARPEGLAGTDAKGKPRDFYYACGWDVRPVGSTGKANAWHTGYIPGSESILVRRWDGLTWAVLFNANNGPDGKSLSGKIDSKLHEAADAVKRWPTAGSS